MNAIEEYHADRLCITPGLSSSLIGDVLTCPAKAWARHAKNPYRLPDSTSGRLDIGSAAHDVLLVGGNLLHIIHADDYRTNKAKDEREEARSTGKIPLLIAQADEVHAMTEVACAKIKACTDFGYDLARDGQSETPVYWQEGGIDCRALPDWVSADGRVVMDYKTTTASCPAAFERGIPQLGYDTQGSWYTRAVGHAKGTAPRFVWLVQEVSAPYLAYFMEASPATLEIAREKVERAIKIWAACVARNEWPGYSDHIQVAHPQAWEFAKAQEDKLQFEGWTPEAFLFGRVEK